MNLLHQSVTYTVTVTLGQALGFLTACFLIMGVDLLRTRRQIRKERGQ